MAPRAMIPDKKMDNGKKDDGMSTDMDMGTPAPMDMNMPMDTMDTKATTEPVLFPAPAADVPPARAPGSFGPRLDGEI